MSKFAFAIVAAAGLASAAFAQTAPTSATYEFRLVPQGAASGLTSGGTTTLTSVTFFLQARAQTAVGTTNLGVNRLSTGNGSVTGNARLFRGDAGLGAFGRIGDPSGQTNTNQLTNFRGFAPDGLGAETAPGSGEFAPGSDTRDLNAFLSDLTSNVNGRRNAAGTAIDSIDAYRGFAFLAVPGAGAPSAAARNPFRSGGVVGLQNGQFTPWADLYSFEVSALSDNNNLITLNAGGFLNIASSVSFTNNAWTVNQALTPTQVSTAFSFTVVPTPAAAALLGLGGLAAARRRR